MIDIIYFSPCKSSETVAFEISNQYNDSTLYNCTFNEIVKTSNDKLFFISPVYDNLIPKTYFQRLEKIKNNYHHVFIILTYGGVGIGNCINDIKDFFSQAVIHSVLLIKTTHCFLKNNNFVINNDLKLRIKDFINISLSNYKGNKTISNIKLKSDFFKKQIDKKRDRIFKIPYTDKSKCIKCMKCYNECPVKCISSSLNTSNSCIHCNRCVKYCDSKARIVQMNKLAILGIRISRIFTRKYKIWK